MKAYQFSLSIIIVNYQSWDLLENCLSSFKRYPPSATFEIIVVDNGAKDIRFDAFKKAHKEILLLKNKGNYGFSHGCNLGASYARGESLLFLNPDTELTEDKAIDTMLRYLDKNADVGIVSCRNLSENGNGKEERFLSPWLLFGFIRFFYRQFNKKKLIKDYPRDSAVWFPGWVTGSVVLINNELFQKIGHWNQERYWMYSEDPDLCFKVTRLGKKVVLLRNLTIKHLGGGTSKPSIESTTRYKTEDFISKHNYIQENSTGVARVLMHTMFFFKLHLLLLAMAFSLLLLQKNKLVIKLKTFTRCWKYYLHALRHRTWKNPRLMDQAR